MDDTTEEVEGYPSELIDRLVEIVDVGENRGGEWHEHGWWLEFALGGSYVSGVFVETGAELSPDSDGARRRARAKRIVNRNQFWGLVRDRLAELVLSGVNEAFLIRSLRDELRRRLAESGEVGKGDQRRAELVERLREMADDPAEIAAFRARLAEKEQDAESKTDEDIAAILHDMANSPILQPTPVERAVDRWAALDDWDRRVSHRLSDAVIDLWLDRFSMRITRTADGD
jgi:hypothetical protein